MRGGIMRKKLIFIAVLLAATALLSSCSLLVDAERSDTSGSTTASEIPSVSEDTSDTTDETNVKPVVPVREVGAPLTVCIDAGHGYTDPGCTTEYLDGRYEREIVTEYADVLKEKLEAAGCRVILLRDDDNYVDADTIASRARELGMSFMEDKLVDDSRFAPYNRCVWANALHRETYIDFFISLHIDSFDSMESVCGTRIYYCSDTSYSSDSARFCESIAEAVKSSLPDTNARPFAKNSSEAYVVTKHTEMPSVLVEMGFATNKTDAENILDETWRDEFCEALSVGILNAEQ